MTLRLITRYLRENRANRQGMSPDDWSDPAYDARYTLGPASPEEHRLETVFVALVEPGEFERELEITARRKLLTEAVQWMRVYQRVAAAEGDYAVYLFAELQLKHARVELRHFCGHQNLDQNSLAHPASLQAEGLRRRLAAICEQYGAPFEEGRFSNPTTKAKT